MPIRPYRNEDWPQVRAIYDLSKPDELRGVVEPGAILSLEADPKMLALFRDSQIIVMVEDDRVAGFAGSRDFFITWLFVHPSCRRRGVATALIGEMLGRLAGPVTLNVATSNAAACALYQRMGFTVEREFTGQFQGTLCKVARLRHDTAA
ncbi:MAG: N-acetyltransferase [Betaproteobacteria bacterium]